MSVITIRQRQQTETGFAATVSCDGAEFGIQVADPFSPQEEADLEWYFEEWLRFPLLDITKAEKARDSVRRYGEALFAQVFRSDPDLYSQYRQCRADLERIEIIGDSPAFQALHWEAMWDSQMPRPLSVDSVVVRKRVKPTAVRATVKPSSVLNLLVVVARPGEERDVGYRTISRPLVELLEQSRLPVNVELLRPATFEALTEHLDEKGAGFYHLIHLDMHGAVMGYNQLENATPNRLTYRFGRPLTPFEGMRAFLAFESGTPGQSDLREAAELADLLTGKGIPVCLLNACQSAKQIRGDERETSLGAALMAAGMQVVVAMGYSVTVSAAEILMQKLYEQLTAGQPLERAMRLGRKALYDNQERKAFFEQKIRLEDWMLPVVYGNRPVEWQLREFSPRESDEYWQQRGSSYRFVSPTYGFVGRDLEILKIERALLRYNVLLVRGMGGTGKTTLLNYLRQWWQTTRFVREVFYFGYDEKAHTLAQILFDIGHRVYDKYEAAQFQAMPEGAQVAKLAATLRAEPYGLMLDNLESVTGEVLAIQNTLDAGEREKVRDFLQQLVGGKTKVVLGSRGEETWLERVLNGAVYELRGLDEESRTVLAKAILARQVGNAGKIAKIREDKDFARLMAVLAGYPLAMEVVLGNLRRQSAAEILAGLDAADVRLDSGSEAKTASILQCVEYSHRYLSPQAQQLLLCLAPFSGFLVRLFLPQYAEQLRQCEPRQTSVTQPCDPPQPPLIRAGLFHFHEF